MIKKVYLAGGCFWGIEAFFAQLDGVIDVISGYANSRVKNPTYYEVKSHVTDAVEAVEITYDSGVISLDKILTYLFGIIDVTAVNHQGGDFGSQYRTGIYYLDDEVKKLALSKIKLLQKDYRKPIAVEVLPLANFYLAEDYHQDYLEKNPDGYCHINLTQVREEDKKIDKEKIYQEVLISASGLISNELPSISVMANLTALLKEHFKTFSWVGFYLSNNQYLYLGPFQGKVACETIQFDRGVCGHAFSTKKTVIVNDVHSFPGHIACDSGSNSEIVLPLFNKHQEIIGVLDIDSYRYVNFDKIDEKYLTLILEKLSLILT